MHHGAVLSVAGLSTLGRRLTIGYLLDRFFAAHIAALLLLVCAAGFLFVIYGRTAGMAFTGAALVGIGLVILAALLFAFLPKYKRTTEAIS